MARITDIWLKTDQKTFLKLLYWFPCRVRWLRSISMGYHTIVWVVSAIFEPFIAFGRKIENCQKKFPSPSMTRYQNSDSYKTLSLCLGNFCMNWILDILIIWTVGVFFDIFRIFFRMAKKGNTFVDFSESKPSETLSLHIWVLKWIGYMVERIWKTLKRDLGQNWGHEVKILWILSKILFILSWAWNQRFD